MAATGGRQEGADGMAAMAGRADRRRERVLAGMVAAPGLAAGTLAVQTADPATDRVALPAGDERAALTAALAAAAVQLGDLAGRGDAVDGESVEFQMGLLEDEALAEPVLERIDEGASAARGWSEVLDDQITEYATADSDYFRARAADLRGLKKRVLRLLRAGGERRSHVPADAIVVAGDLTPSGFLEIDWTRARGLALAGGTPTSHVAMLARARGVPLLVGLGAGIEPLRDGAPAILDAVDGRLIVDPAAATATECERRMAEQAARRAAEARHLAGQARTADGHPVAVMVNADDPDLLAGIDPAHCDGIGLVRTEFLFREAGDLPEEELQYRAYVRLLDWAAGRPVTVRTLDAGGDQVPAGAGTANPLLGLRGVRLSLARPDVFRAQLRALARAAAHGPIRAMVPMVTVPDELAAARALRDRVVAELASEGVAATLPPLGMMVEVPAAALTIDRFDADFLAIGGNDLVQYAMAASRDDGRVTHLHDPLNPAVTELVRRVVAHGRARGVEVALCGDMAADPAVLPTLLATGLAAVSVSPAALARTKAAIARHPGVSA